MYVLIIYFRPKVTLHFSVLDIAILVLILSKLNIFTSITYAIMRLSSMNEPIFDDFAIIRHTRVP